MNLCEVILYRKYPPSLTRRTSVTSCTYYVSFKYPNLLYLPELFVFKLNKPITWLHSLCLCLFWTFWSNKLNCSKTEAPFQTETWTSLSQLPFMKVDNVKSFTQALTYTSSDIHGIRKSICTPIHVFKKIYLAFFIENWMLQRCLRRNSEVFTAFYDIHIVKKWRHSWGTRVLQMSLTPKPHVKMN